MRAPQRHVSIVAAFTLGVFGGIVLWSIRTPLRPVVSTGDSLLDHQDALSAGVSGATHESKANQDALPSDKLTLAALQESLESKVARFAAGLSFAQIVGILDQLSAMPDAASTRSLRMELARVLAAHDPEKAWEYAESATRARDKQDLMSALAGEIVKTQPTLAAKLVSGIYAPDMRRNVMQQLFRDWMESDPKAAVSYMRAHPEAQIDTTARTLGFSALAGKNPTLAAELAMQSHTGTSFDSGLTAVMRQWADKDMNAALQWANGLPSTKERELALLALAGAAMETDPTKAWEIANAAGGGTLRADAAKTLLGGWMGKDPKGVMSYLSKLPDSQAADLAGSLYYTLGQLPLTDQQQLLQGLPEGNAKGKLAAHVVSSYQTKGNYKDAIAMLNVMNDGNHRDQALHNLVSEWTKKDPASVSEWINEQPDSTDRDMMLAALAANTASNDPKTGVQQLSMISDPLVRKGAMRNTFRAWARLNVKDAVAWLNGVSDFSAVEKGAMIKILTTSPTTVMPAPSVAKYR
jgi:hypothetical protein